MTTYRACRCLVGSIAIMTLAIADAAAQGRQAPGDAALTRALAVPDTTTIRAHLEFLADDALEGRGAGARGGAIAARYIATQFQLMGLQPAAGGSYYQSVPLLGMTPEPSLVVGIGRQTVALASPRDYVAWPAQPESSISVDGDVVFVGYGIQAPEYEWDDYQGLSVAGKVVLVLANDPGLTDATLFGGRRLTRHGRWEAKLEQAARMGAVGVILIHSERSANDSWPAVQSTWTGELVRSREHSPTTLRFAAWLTAEAARRLVEQTSRDYDLLVRRAQLREFRPIPLGAHAAVHVRSRVRPLDGVNVIARVPGSDTALRETVLLTAHYDHLGVGRPVDGDSIYNGAEDNAAGVATLLAAAKGLAAAAQTLRRHIIVMATTAEEAGSLGTEAYVRDPAAPLEWTVAAVNLDRAAVRGPTRDAVALGADWSNLGGVFQRIAVAEGLVAAAYPFPERGDFYRSDHAPLARAGVPAIALHPGVTVVDRPKDWALAEEQRYVAERYHRPNDEITDGMSFEGAVQQARLLIRLAFELGGTDTFPSWRPDAPFRAAGDRLRLRRGRP